MFKINLELPWRLSVKESARQSRKCGFDPWVRKIPWRKKWQLIPIFLPWKSHGQRNQTIVHGIAKALDIVTKLQQNITMLSINSI